MPWEINITYSECVSVDLDTKNAMRMRRIISPNETCLVMPYFYALSR
jgi:hypothetical protein